MLKAIETPKAPKAIGPYSQGIEAAGLVFVSGQLPADPDTGSIPSEGDVVEAQAHQSLKNVRSILEAEGLGMDNVVMTTVYIQNMSDFAKVNAIYSQYFKAPYPARACVEVAKLPKGALLEIAAIAAK